MFMLARERAAKLMASAQHGGIAPKANETYILTNLCDFCFQCTDDQKLGN